MSLKGDIKFQKALALAASASNAFEAATAELAARRLKAQYDIDPTNIPDQSLYSGATFADNALLKKLRDEYREQHPAPPPKKPKRSNIPLEQLRKWWAKASAAERRTFPAELVEESRSEQHSD